MDILHILEESAAEIRALRESKATYKLLYANLTIRMALAQLKHGPLRYRNEFKENWDSIVALVDAKRLLMDSGGECVLDGETLTPERLRDATEAIKF